MRPLFNRLNAILASLLAVITLVGFVMVPRNTKVPVHWNFGGKVDRLLPRDLALVQLPLVVIAVAAILYFVAGALTRYMRSHPELVATQEQTELQVSRALSLVLALVAASQAVIVMHGMGLAPDTLKITAIVLGVGYVALGNLLPKGRPSGLSWPNALNNPATWRAVHQATGLAMIFVGVGLCAAALMGISGGALTTLLLFAAVGPGLVGLVLALMHAKKHGKS